MQDPYYFVSPENTKVGPIPWTVLEQLHAAGTINDETLAAPEGASEWYRFQNLKEQRAVPGDSPGTRSNPKDSEFNLQGIAGKVGEWLAKVVPGPMAAKFREKKAMIVLASAIAALVALAGYSLLGFLGGEESYSDYEEESAYYWRQNVPDSTASGFPQFNPNLSAQEYNDLYARQNSSVQGGMLNRGMGTTQDSMNNAMQNAANAFGSGTSGQTYQPPPPQNRPAALSTFGNQPKRYRNLQGEVREFIGIPPAGWIPLNH